MTKEGSIKIVTFMTPVTGVLALGRQIFFSTPRPSSQAKCPIRSSESDTWLAKMLQGINQTNYVYRKDDQGRVYQNCNFHDPGAAVFVQGEAICPIKIFFSTPRHRTKYIAMMTKEGLTKIVNFMTLRAGVLVLGCGHISHVVKMHLFL